MNKYKNLLFFLLLLVIIISLVISNSNIYNKNCIEKFTQEKNRVEVDSFDLESHPFKNNNIPISVSSNLENINQVFAEEDQLNSNKQLLLDQKFAKEYPELYEKILKIVFKDYIKNPQDIEYTLTVSNKSNDEYFSTNLLSSISNLDPVQLHKIKIAIEQQGIPEGNCNSAYPHPSYAILNDFKELSTCNSDCEKTDKNGSCLPVAFNCLIQDK